MTERKILINPLSFGMNILTAEAILRSEAEAADVVTVEVEIDALNHLVLDLPPPSLPKPCRELSPLVLKDDHDKKRFRPRDSYRRKGR